MGAAVISGAPTFRAQLAAATAMLEAAGVSTARVDAEWLLAGLLGIGRAAVRMDVSRVLAPPLVERYADAVRRRARREPLQRILGWEEFRGLRIRLTDAVLVPRPETEALVEWALALLPSASGRRLLALDVGAGSGCIACSLAAERPDLDVVAIDVSPDAAAVASGNARALGLAPRVRVVVVDLLDGVRGLAADLIVSNPPYLPTGVLAGLEPEVRSHEPRLALDGGADGLTLIRRLVGAARPRLRPGGVLLVETAGGAQAAEAAAMFQGVGFQFVAVRADLAGVDRFVAGSAR
jgi:release factor glutamine methyltransferase